MSEPTWRAFALVASGAVLGALARWGITTSLVRVVPYGTLSVNIVGSFLMGALLLGGLLQREQVQLFLAIGFLGSLTTMSAFSAETLLYLQEGAYPRAALHALGHPLACVASAFLGGLLGRALAG